MKAILSTVIAILVLSMSALGVETGFKLFGVKIRVPDIEEAKRFYVDLLHFEIEKEDREKRILWLKTNSYKVVIEQSKDARRITDPGASHISFTLRVNDIDETHRKLKAANVQLLRDEKRKEGIGYSLQILDPFGNKISMMQVTAGKQEKINEPSVYNCGLNVTDIETALKTYQDKLGFVVLSRAYMPDDLPLGTAGGKFSFMLHLRRTDYPFVENPNMLLMLRTDDPNAMDELKKAGVKLKKTNDERVFQMIDGLGIRSEIIFSPKQSVAETNRTENDLPKKQQ